MTTIYTDQNTNSKGRSEAPAEKIIIDLSASLPKEPKYVDVDYTAFYIEQLEGVIKCTACVDEDALKALEELTDEERCDLQRCERVIAETKESFYQFALALEEIKRRKLYRDRFKTFPEYCLKVHGLGQSYAYRQAAAGKFLRENSPMGEKAAKTERGARKLIADDKAKRKPAELKAADVEVTDEAPPAVEEHEVPAVKVVEPASPIIPLPVSPTDSPTSLHELHAIAEKTYNIHSDRERIKELESLLRKLKRELGRWAELEKQQQQQEAA